MLSDNSELSSCGIAVNLIFPYTIFIIILYGKYFLSYLFILGAIATVISLAGIILINMKRIKRRNADIRKLIFKRRVKRSIKLFRNNLARAALLFLVPVMVNKIFSNSIINSQVAVTSTYGGEYTLENNIDIILNLQEDTWDSLNAKEKLDTCQVLANCEGNYLGISHELNVSSGTLKNDTLAFYKENTHQIVIDLNYLEDASSREVCEAICHEAYHAYSYELVRLYQNASPSERNLLLFDNAASYMNELSDYKDAARDGVDAYLGQFCERDAYVYGSARAYGYFLEIRECTGNK